MPNADPQRGLPPFDTGLPHEALTPEGQISAAGAFARGVGPRRMKIAIFGTGMFVVLFGFVLLLE